MKHLLSYGSIDLPIERSLALQPTPYRIRLRGPFSKLIDALAEFIHVAAKLVHLGLQKIEGLGRPFTALAPGSAWSGRPDRALRAPGPAVIVLPPHIAHILLAWFVRVHNDFGRTGNVRNRSLSIGGADRI